MKTQPLISIITTVYNCEKYLSRCVNSVLSNSYKNIELIIVDDNSPGNFDDAVKIFTNQPQVVVLRNEKNLGLFHARLAGAAVAKGEYLAFVDSDDHVSIDFYRTLLKMALETDSDLVLGDFVIESDHPDLTYSIRKTSFVRNNELDIRDNEIKDLFYKSMGLENEIVYMWNKLIRRDLWEKCLPYYNKIQGNIVNTEDVLFSSVLYFYANHLTNCHGDFYFYYSREDSSLNQKKTFSTIQKDISNNIQTFSFILDFLKKQKYNQYLDYIWNWYFFYIDFKRKDINNGDCTIFERKKLFSLIDEIPFPKGIAFPREENDFLFSSKSYLQTNVLLGEELKKKICDSSIKAISFDIFDTLVTRPFYYPTDLFCLLEISATRILGITDKIRFKDLRIEAENRARQKKRISNPMFQEVTLDEIYSEIQELTGFESEKIEEIKKEELSLELKYCKQRKYAKELFDLSKFLKKKIVITSDMYLSKSFLELMLNNCGYTDYDAIYVSSQERITKSSSKLFKKISNDFGLKPHEILHIGDNLDSDINVAQKLGLKTGYLPRTVNVLSNEAGPDFWAGETVNKVFQQSFSSRRAGTFNDFFGIRVMLAVVANKLFDNPFNPFDKYSDFNSSAFFIGYFPLGMHLFAIGHWLHTELKKEKYERINFMARDGYLPMEAFKILNTIYKNPIKTNFLHLSRKTILPLQIQNENDIYSASTNLNLWCQTPRKMINLLKNLIQEKNLKGIEDKCKHAGFLFDDYFPNIDSFYLFCRFFKEKLFSQKKSNEYKETFKKDFSMYFTGKTASFDIGYSCRIESLVNELFNCDITPFYIHINNDIPLFRAEKTKIQINTFLNYEPGVTGLQRELLISKLEGAVVSYERENGQLIPVYSEIEYNRTAQTIINEIQKSALSFVKDMITIFGDEIKYLFFTREDASLPLDYFLNQPKMADRHLFSIITIEDELGTKNGKINFNDYWDMQLCTTINQYTPIVVENEYTNLKSKYQKFIYLLFMDRATLKLKIKAHYHNHPLFLKFLRGIYRFMRRLYHLKKRM